MKPKILITMQGGTIQNISASEDMDIAIVDYDLPDHGEPALMGIYGPDYIVKDRELHEMIDTIPGAELTPEEARVKEGLKRLHF